MQEVLKTEGNMAHKNPTISMLTLYMNGLDNQI